MTLIVREDVSHVVPQRGYVAKRCPQRVAFDADPPRGVEPLEPSATDLARMRAGDEFEAEVFESLFHLQGEVVADLRDPGSDRQGLEDATRHAMDEGTQVVIGGRLPTDLEGRRVGYPDVLVRGSRQAQGGWGYHPVDVKHHKTVSDLSKRTADPLRRATLDEFTTSPADLPEADDLEMRRGSLGDDLLQLAHYHRMLEACGFADEQPWGGIIGSDEVCTWVRLDEQFWTSWRTSDDRWSSLEQYDHEFGFRLDILARIDRNADAGVVPAYV